jgi:excinuclease UvrABC nuclease subunit
VAKANQVGKFFGPYPSAYNARDTLLVLQKLFNVRQCENSYFSQRKRPCLQYQIKRCTAPCVGLISPQDYKEDVDNSIRFLQGDTKELNQELIAKMEQAAEQLEFEKAVFIVIVWRCCVKFRHNKRYLKSKVRPIFWRLPIKRCDLCANHACP